ncbi:hypothetical protein PHAVU_003G093700 [Phaseolus vulgaris]|uniref:Uncharacterized protein n=1 Tax=Phaseolus vulgaris TaxID=3885 RepID=V7C9W1_PHAVU|nr:hypothetical protein PHAVU_003G093700g [Phaseolus vulgaris]ESW26133.1 hypothetical protein PHAVU_003G093700g [Phaseolus vulgaris]
MRDTGDMYKEKKQDIFVISSDTCCKNMDLWTMLQIKKGFAINMAKNKAFSSSMTFHYSHIFIYFFDMMHVIGGSIGVNLVEMSSSTVVLSISSLYEKTMG